MTVSFKPKIPENCNTFCSASESYKQNPQDRTLDLPLFFCHQDITSLKTTFRLHKARVCLSAFGGTFAAMIVLIY